MGGKFGGLGWRSRIYRVTNINRFKLDNLIQQPDAIVRRWPSPFLQRYPEDIMLRCIKG